MLVDNRWLKSNKAQTRLSWIKVTGKLPAQPVKFGGQQKNNFLAGPGKKKKRYRKPLSEKEKVTGKLPASQLAGKLPVAFSFFENSGQVGGKFEKLPAGPVTF